MDENNLNPTQETPEMPELPTAASFLQKQPIRWTAQYEITEPQYLAFNEFIFANMEAMKQTRARMKYFGIGSLVIGLVVLAFGLFTQKNVALMTVTAVALMAAGVLAMLYYPFIFPKQFRKSIHQSFSSSGYMGRELKVDFYDDGLVESSEEPVGALWEDVKGLAETEELILFLMEEHQAVVVPKTAFREKYDEFLAFCEKKIRN